MLSISARLLASNIPAAPLPSQRRQEQRIRRRSHVSRTGNHHNFQVGHQAVEAVYSCFERIEVANQRSGYNHFYSYVGGFWGTYSGPSASFRGGGPGAGK